MPPSKDNDVDAIQRLFQASMDAGDGGEDLANDNIDSDDEKRNLFTERKSRKRRKDLESTGADEKKGKKKILPIVDQAEVEIENVFFEFLESFEDGKYQKIGQSLIERAKTTMRVDFKDVIYYSQDMGTLIHEEHYRFKPALERAVFRFVEKLSPEYVRYAGESAKTKDFQISFVNMPSVERVRDLRTNLLGKLIAMTGTVTRSSETRPELVAGTFTCNECGTTRYDVVQEFKYTEPNSCSCTKNRTSWSLEMERSKFADWQRLRVQENASEVPAGSMPRSMEIIVRNEGVERAKPGDKCIFTGSLVVVPDVSKLKAPGDPPGLSIPRGVKRSGDDEGVTGLSILGVRDLTYRLAFLACTVETCDGNGLVNEVEDSGEGLTRTEMCLRIRSSFTEEDKQEFIRMSETPNLIEKMKRSFAPAIYGHGDIKFGVLLLLFGGVHKKTPDNINLRGDINVCIVGDPSTAKSQFLRYVCSFSPRAVYTSGKASSAAGLTASVLRDAETGEFCIEAGALMLADNGVCCIDEFDKMDDYDQVAIHEAMEQQTISITKAGIQATLNARTSVLAAANPIHGRYDRSKSLKANLTVGPAIMSRFDLFFVVLDDCDEVHDRAVASHIVEVHRKRTAANQTSSALASSDWEEEVNDGSRFTPDALKRYLKFARTIDPQFPPEIQPLLVDYYVKLRQGDSGVGLGKQAYRITVRQLEAMLRLSEAIARMHLDLEVKKEYVEKAFHLLRTSIVQIESETIFLGNPQQPPSRGPGETADEEQQDPLNLAHTYEDHAYISQAEFQRMAKAVFQFVKDTKDVQGDDFPGIEVTEIIMHVLEKHMAEDIMNESQIQQARDQVNAVIRKMIETEGMLMEIVPESSFEFSQSAQDNEKYLVDIHPNFSW